MDLLVSEANSTRFAEYLFTLNSSSDLSEAFTLLESHVIRLGFDALSYSAMPKSLGVTGSFMPVFLTSSDFSTDFLNHYAEDDLWKQDFTIDRIQNGFTEVMDWQLEARKTTFKAPQKEVVDIASYEYGIKNALTVPTQSDEHIVAGASLIAYTDRAQFEKIMASHCAEVQKLVHAFHQFVFNQTVTASYFYQPLIDQLTDSQKRVLAFIVTGRPQKHSKEFIGLSPTRTGNVLSELYECFDVSNVSQLSYLAGRHKLVDMLDA